MPKIYLLTRVFCSIKSSAFAGNPPTKEIYDALFKLYSKGSNQNLFKIHCMKGISRIIKANTQNTSIIIPEIIKNNVKIIDKTY